jgi:sugar/nucleoside kinase (ribokinase family)
MKKFDVYGIGNALLDMVYEVTPEFLNAMGIEKGLMTLVDEDRQTELLGIVKDLLGVKSCGGSCANTMIAISQFGGKAFLSCKVADDIEGNYYQKDLLANGVESNLMDGLKNGVTGKCVVFITPDADRTMNTFLGITEQFSVEELREDEIKNSKYVYIEGYLVTSKTGKEAAIKTRKIAQKNNVSVALTLSDPGIVTHFKKEFLEIMNGKIDLLFCNEEEAKTFTGKSDVKKAFCELKKYSNAFAITLGPNGAIIFDGKNTFEVKGRKVDAIDTNGAGDLFAGTFLYAITNEIGFEKAGELACYASSELVTTLGARLVKENVQKIRKKIIGK